MTFTGFLSTFFFTSCFIFLGFSSGLFFSSFIISFCSAFSIYLGLGGGSFFASSMTFSGFFFNFFYTFYFISNGFSLGLTYSSFLISIISAFSIYLRVGGGVVSSMTFSGFFLIFFFTSFLIS